MRDVSGAKVGCKHADADFVVIRFGYGCKIKCGLIELSAERSRKLSRYAVNILAVCKVCSDRNIPHFIIKPKIALDVCTGKCVRAEHHYAVDRRAVIPIVIYAEFFTRAKHTVGFNASELAFFDCDNLGGGR